MEWFLAIGCNKKGISKPFPKLSFIITVKGPFPSTLQQTMAKVYSEWLPASNYEVIKAPSFSFTKMNQPREGFAFSEIWIPVRKK